MISMKVKSLSFPAEGKKWILIVVVLTQLDAFFLRYSFKKHTTKLANKI